VDIRDLVSLDEVMDELKLGPNGAMIYCMEYLEQNFDWLEERLAEVRKGLAGGASEAEGSVKGPVYFVIDCPGQVELVTHHPSVKTVLLRMQRELDFQLVAVHLVDAHYCSEPAKYISAALLSLSTMLRLELPHVNVLSKMDLLEKYGALEQPLSFYTGAHDIARVLSTSDQGWGAHEAADAGLDSPEGEREDMRTREARAGARPALGRSFRRLNEAFCELVQDFRLVSFHTLDVRRKESIARLLRTIDQAAGYTGPGAAALAALPLNMDDGRRGEHSHDETERYSTAFGAAAPVGTCVAASAESEGRGPTSTPAEGSAASTRPVVERTWAGSRHAESPAATVLTAASGSLLSDDEWARITRVVPASTDEAPSA
jgi:hypothetical protein